MNKAHPQDSFPAPTVPADPKQELSKRAAQKTRTRREGEEPRHSGWGVHQQDEQS